jgi:hypothetical protein
MGDVCNNNNNNNKYNGNNNNNKSEKQFSLSSQNEPEFYFEKQKLLYCAIHAVNNLVCVCLECGFVLLNFVLKELITFFSVSKATLFKA